MNGNIRSFFRSLWEGLRGFWNSRKDRRFALYVALLALGFYLFLGLLDTPPPERRLLKEPLPPAAAVFGEGVPEWSLVLWWRCPACKNLVGRMEAGLLGQRPWKEPFAVYFYDLSPEDEERTAFFLCAPGDPGKKLLRLSKERPSGEELAPLRDTPCFAEAKSWSRKVRSALQAGRVEWTPALIQKGALLGPREEHYKEFLWRVLGERW